PRQVNDAVWSPALPEPQPGSKVLAINASLAKALGAPWSTMDDPTWAKVVGGEMVLPGTKPWSLRYGGHQFGQWAGQLGDGRAVSLGVWSKEASDQGMEVQLKGCGRTPYSRFGDGYAVVRSSIREFLASEALTALGIPSSRALAMVQTERVVQREIDEPGAVVARVAPSWIRFGNFEMHAARSEWDLLRRLADYTITHHFPQLAPGDYKGWFEEVMRKSAETAAGWQSVGFCHGVLNTDNMSILGLTIDYGPYAFLDQYDPGFICNHSDEEGRYSFENQPKVVLWNLAMLARAISPLLAKQARGSPIVKLDPEGEGEGWKDLMEEGSKVAATSLSQYQAVYEVAFAQRMIKKLGLMEPAEGDLAGLIHPLLAILGQARVDYTRFWRAFSSTSLSDLPNLMEKYLSENTQEGGKGTTDNSSVISLWKGWCEVYTLRASQEDEGQRERKMLEANPKYILRNWVAQEIIEATE
ncbi:SelO family protein, partial [Piptocephalis cylindrospora]